MKTSVYPGTFDPVTYGHIDIIERAAELFDRVIVTVAVNSAKTPIFTLEERVNMIEESLRERNNHTNIEVSSFKGLLVDFARENNAAAIIRGLRAISDFEYEFQMALMNRKLAPDVKTVFLMPGEQYTYLNSTIIRELARMKCDVSDFVSPYVQKRLREKFG